MKSMTTILYFFIYCNIELFLLKSFNDFCKLLNIFFRTLFYNIIFLFSNSCLSDYICVHTDKEHLGMLL